MAWIKVDQTIKDHRKICAAADLLDIEPFSMVGAMVCFWIWALDNAPDGSLEGVSSKTIARAMGWKGDPAFLVKVLEDTGFLGIDDDAELYIHDWNDYTGDLVARRKKEAQRKAEKRAKMSAVCPQTVRSLSADCPQTVRDKSRVEKSRVEKSREEEKDRSLSPKTGERDKSAEPTRQLPTPVEKIRELWNDTCLSLPKVREIVGKRQKMLGARWKDHPALDWWSDYFDRIQASSFLTGKNDRGWKAKFDWVIEPANMNKVLEGNYDEKPKEVKPHELTAEDYLRGFSS